MGSKAPLSIENARRTFTNASATIGFAIGLPLTVGATVLELEVCRVLPLVFFPAMLVLFGALGHVLLRRALERRAHASLVAIPGSLAIALAGGASAAVAIDPLRWPTDVDPALLVRPMLGTITILALATGALLAGALALLHRIARRLHGALDDATRAAHDAWIVVFVAFAAAAMVITGIGRVPNDAIPFIGLATAVIGALAAATNAVLAQLEIQARDAWLRDVAAAREPRYRIAPRTELPATVDLPCVDARPEECDGILIEAEAHAADIAYRRLPRAVALVRSRP